MAATTPTTSTGGGGGGGSERATCAARRGCAQSSNPGWRPAARRARRLRTVLTIGAAAVVAAAAAVGMGGGVVAQPAGRGNGASWDGGGTVDGGGGGNGRGRGAGGGNGNGVAMKPLGVNNLTWAAVCKAAPPAPITRTIPERGGGRCPPPGRWGAAHVRLSRPKAAPGAMGAAPPVMYATAMGNGRDVYVSRVDATGAVVSAFPLRARLRGDYGGTLQRIVSIGGSLTGVGDLDGDGIEDLAVGATVVPKAAAAGVDGSSNDTTSAIFIVTLTPRGEVKASNLLVLSKGFGCPPKSTLACNHTVSGVGDVDGDGTGDVVVMSNWRTVAVVTLSPTAEGNYKAVTAVRQSRYLDQGGGRSAPPDPVVVGVGDVDGDGVPDAVMNDPWYGGGRGALIVLSLSRDGGLAGERILSGARGGEGGLPAGHGGGPGAEWGAVLAAAGTAPDGGVVLAAAPRGRRGWSFLYLPAGGGDVARVREVAVPVPVTALHGPGGGGGDDEAAFGVTMAVPAPWGTALNLFSFVL